MNREMPSEEPKIDILDRNMAALFKSFQECLYFFLERATQITKRFSLKDKILEKLNYIDPVSVTSDTHNSIIPLVRYFPNLVNEKTLQSIDNKSLLRNTKIKFKNVEKVQNFGPA